MSRRGTNIRKRADGRWEGRYYIPDQSGTKKCKSVYGHSYKETSDKLNAAKTAVQSRIARAGLSTVTVDEAANKWLESIRTNRKLSTYQKYSIIYAEYIKPQWGDALVDELDSGEIVTALPDTLSTSICKSIMSIFNLIIEYGNVLYGTNLIHLSYKSIHSPATSTNNTNTINITDQQKLIKYLLTDLDIYKLGILLCLFMGLRLGEVCALKWEDIDMRCRTLHVNRTVQRLRTDTACDESSDSTLSAKKKTILYVTAPKTSNSIREIPIPDFIFQRLSAFHDNITDDDSYILCGKVPMEPRRYQYRFRSYMKQAGIEYTHFHALRHTFATNCISSGADAKSVSEILGHSNVNITLNRYVHPNMETKRSAINSISIP